MVSLKTYIVLKLHLNIYLKILQEKSFLNILGCEIKYKVSFFKIINKESEIERERDFDKFLYPDNVFTF